jgi:stage IV sporulation protein FB
MFGEPAPTQGDIHFRLFGLPVRIHPLFWLVAVVLGSKSGGAVEILIWVAAVFISILVHEMGHALVIKAYGFRPWIVLYGMGGLACHDPAENRASKANTHLGQISISISGPLAGFLLAAALIAVLYSVGFRHQIIFTKPFNITPFWLDVANLQDLFTGQIGLTRRSQLVNDIFFISVFWGLMNLLPIYPLDGGQIAREILLYFNPRDGIRQSLILSIFTAGLAALYGLQSQDWYICIFFAYMAYESFSIMQSYTDHRGW